MWLLQNENSFQHWLWPSCFMYFFVFCWVQLFLVPPLLSHVHSIWALIPCIITSSSRVRVGHGWVTAQGTGYKGAPWRPPPYLHSLVKQNLYLLINSLKAKKSLWWQHWSYFFINGYFIISFAFFRMGLNCS